MREVIKKDKFKTIMLTKHKFHPLSNIQIKLQILDFPNPNNPVVILRSRWSLHYPAIVPIEGAVLFKLGFPQ
jgi:hypothetical protein